MICTNFRNKFQGLKQAENVPEYGIGNACS